MKKIALPTFEAVLEFTPIRWIRHTRFGRRLSTVPVIERLIQRVWKQWNLRTGASFSTSPLEPRQEAIPSDGSPIRVEKDSNITTRFIVLSEGRSGSTLLVDELGRRWDEIRSEREVFQWKWRGSKSFEAIARRTFIQDTGHAIVGCKILLLQVSDEQLTQLLELQGMRVIFLRRRNLLRRYVSLKIAEQTDLWRQSSREKVRIPTLEERRITIRTDNFYQRTMTTFAYFRRFEELAASVPSIDVYYEDLSSDLNNELRRIAEFLGAGEPSREDPPLLTKQNPESLEDLILNFDEVCSFLSEVGMSEFITMDEADHESRESSRTLRCWPSPSQKELFTAVFGPENLFEERWDKWLSQAKAWTLMEDLDGLQPLIHRRLRLSRPESRISKDFRADSTRTIASNLRFRTHLVEILDRFQKDGISATFVGDAALTFSLSSKANHSMQFHVLEFVPRPDHLEATIGALEEEGWSVVQSADDHPGDVTLQLDDVENLSPIRIKVNQHVLRFSDQHALDEELLRNAHRASEGTSRLRRLAPGDLLFSLIVDGLLVRPARSLLWIPRSHALLASSEEGIDWDRFIRLASEYELVPAIRQALDLLAEVSPGLIDSKIIDRVHALPVRDETRIAFETAMTPC